MTGDGEENSAPRVFVSSVMAELAPEREVAVAQIREMGLRPVWFEGFSSAADLKPMRTAIEKLKSSNYLVAILWREISGSVIEEINAAVHRQIPVHVFVKKLVDVRGETRSASLSAYLACPPWTYKEFSGTEELKLEIRHGLAGSVLAAINSSFRPMSAEQFYNLGRELISKAESRIVDLPHVSALLLGPRPLGSRHASGYEIEHCKTFDEAFNRAVGGKIQYHTGTLIPETAETIRSELGGLNQSERASATVEVRSRLERLLAASGVGKGNFTFACPETSWGLGFGYTVIDDTYIIRLRDLSVSGMWLCSSAKNARVADTLTLLFERICRRYSAIDPDRSRLIEVLGLT